MLELAEGGSQVRWADGRSPSDVQLREPHAQNQGLVLVEVDSIVVAAVDDHLCEKNVSKEMIGQRVRMSYIPRWKKSSPSI